MERSVFPSKTSKDQPVKHGRPAKPWLDRFAMEGVGGLTGGRSFLHCHAGTHVVSRPLPYTSSRAQAQGHAGVLLNASIQQRRLRSFGVSAWRPVIGCCPPVFILRFLYLRISPVEKTRFLDRRRGT
jgi:hypothetical protein